MIPQFEPVAMTDGSFIRSLHVRCRNFQDNHTWHFHPEFEISYILKGAGTRFIGDSVEAFQAGELLLLGPNVPHCWVSSDTHQPCEMLVLQFNAKHLGDAFWELSDMTELKSWLDGAKRGIRFSLGLEGDTHRFFRQVIEDNGLARFSSFWQLLASLMNLPGQHPVVSECYRLDGAKFHGGRLSKVISYIREHLTGQIKQAVVADRVGMTSQSFSRFFKASTGRTFVSFVNQMRVAEVCRLLEETDTDVMDIAYCCGYNNLSNFNRRFAEVMNTTPSDYRLALRQKVALDAV